MHIYNIISSHTSIYLIDRTQGRIFPALEIIESEGEEGIEASASGTDESEFSDIDEFLCGGTHCKFKI